MEFNARIFMKYFSCKNVITFIKNSSKTKNVDKIKMYIILSKTSLFVLLTELRNCGSVYLHTLEVLETAV